MDLFGVQPAGSPVTASAPGPSLHVLVAEDNAVNRRLAVLYLQKLGHHADVAANGFEVLEALERQRYDVVLMDMQMPDMDGLDATRAIRQRWSESERPRIVAVTTDDISGDREACMAAGMDDFVSKPVTIEGLAEALGRCASASPPKEERPDRALRSPDSAVNDYPLDRAAIRELRDVLGVEAFDGMVTLFRNESLPMVSQLHEAVLAGDCEAVADRAHGLHSSSLLVSAFALAAACKQLERLARTGQLDDAAELSRQVQRLHASSVDALEDQRRSGRTS